MLEFAIFVIVVIAVSIVSKTAKRSSTSNGRPNPRVQKMIERIQAQQANQPVRLQGQFTQARQLPARPVPNQYAALQPYPQPVQNPMPPAHRPPQNDLP